MFSAHLSLVTVTLLSPRTVFELPGDGGCRVEPPTVFLTPQHMVKLCTGGQLYTIYIGFTSQFWSDSDGHKIQPPANFSQFKH